MSIYVFRTNYIVILCQDVITQVTEEIAAFRAATVIMDFLEARKLENVPRGVHLAMKERIVTKVNTKLS